MDLLSKMHEMYSRDNVSIYVCDLLEKFLTKVNRDLNEIEYNRFLEFATFYLIQKEKELGLFAGSLSLKERWDNVRRKLLSRGHLSLEGAKSVVLIYSPEGAELTYSAIDSTLFVTVENSVSRENLLKLREALTDYLPAHILIWDFETHMNTHGDIEEGKRAYGGLEIFSYDDMLYKYAVIRKN